MIIEEKNKKSGSETSVLARKVKGCYFGEKNELEFERCLSSSTKKLSKSLDELNLTSLRNSEKTSFAKKEASFKGDALRNQNNDKVVFYKAEISDDKVNKFAKRCIISLLLLNAWRKHKTSHKVILEKMENLNEKLEGFEMQVYLLRQLLNSEKGRVESANENIHSLVKEIKKCKKDRSEILKKSKKLENDVNHLSEYCCQMEGVLKTQENVITNSLQEAKNLESQLKKDREKLKEMEVEELGLKEKVKIYQDALMAKTEEVMELKENNKHHEEKWTMQALIWKENMETVRSDLQKALNLKTEELKRLSSTVAALEQKLMEEDEKNGILAKSVVEKTKELNDVENKLQEILKTNARWSGKIKIKMASICAKIPVACICTVASLLLPFPSYRI